MIVFSPWAFGTTQAWAVSTMNAFGYFLGVLLLIKILAREVAEKPEGAQADYPVCRRRGWDIKLLGMLTVVILGYCLISALNARSTYDPSTSEFIYHNCFGWLPHSYDSRLSWQAFWNFLALACAFWAARDWLLSDPSRQQEASEQQRPDARRRGYTVLKRLRILLWVIAINGGLIGVEGLLQHAMGDGRLLWLVRPSINRDPDGQFGPYAYRSNAAQYFLLAWPAVLGFWWVLRAQTRRSESTQHNYRNLLPCIFVMTLVPIICLSRASAVIGLLNLLLALFVITRAEWQLSRKRWPGILLLLGAVLAIGIGMEGRQLSNRLRRENWDSDRVQTWKNALQMIKHNAVFGTGPGTFDSVYHLYREDANDRWQSMAHNDWLETLVTFGTAGSTLILLFLALVLRRRCAPQGIPINRVFVQLLSLGIGSCLVYALGDFPFQVYSILFLFVIECAVLCTAFPVPRTGGVD